MSSGIANSVARTSTSGVELVVRVALGHDYRLRQRASRGVECRRSLSTSSGGGGSSGRSSSSIGGRSAGGGRSDGGDGGEVRVRAAVGAGADRRAERARRGALLLVVVGALGLRLRHLEARQRHASVEPGARPLPELRSIEHRAMSREARRVTSGTPSNRILDKEPEGRRMEMSSVHINRRSNANQLMSLAF